MWFYPQIGISGLTERQESAQHRFRGTKKGLGLDLQTVKLFKKPQLMAQILFKESLNAE